MMAAGAQELVARGDFDEDGDIASWSQRHADERDAQSQNLEEDVVQAEALVGAGRVPPFELHDELGHVWTTASRRCRRAPSH